MRHVREFLNKLKKQTGSSLAEMMVVTGIMGIVGIGIATLMTNMTATQQKTNVVAVLGQKRQIVLDSILDGKAWANTVAFSNDTAPTTFGSNNPGLKCLQLPLYNCENGAVNTLKDKDGNAVSNMHYITELKNSSNANANNISTGTKGFNATGADCDAFDATNGSNACPFRYNVAWVPLSNTKNPQVRVVANLVFKPATATFFPNINEANYTIDMTRGAQVKNDPFLLTHEQASGNTGGGGCDGSTGPPRTINAYVKRTFASAYNIRENVGGNVVSTTADSFTLGAGTYNCKITAPAFGIRGTKLKIASSASAADVSAVSSGATEGPGSYASFSPSTGTVAQFDVTLTLTANTSLSVYQYCEIANNTYDLGLPVGIVGSYGVTIYTQVRCVRTS